MNFLSGPKSSSNVGQLIDVATDANDPEDKIELFYEICDLINTREEVAKEALRAIRKKMNVYSGKNWFVIQKLLKLLDICANNCNSKFQVQLSNKEFLTEMKTMIGPKLQPPIIIQESVLALIEKWAIIFKDRSDMKAIHSFYSELKQKGIEFPVDTHSKDQQSKLEINSASMSHEAVPMPGYAVKPVQSLRTIVPNAAQAVRLNEEQISKLQKELYLVDVNIVIMNDIISEYQTNSNTKTVHNNLAKDKAFLKEIFSTTSEMQKRITQLIGNVSNESIISELLRINDDLNNVFLRYERFDKRFNSTNPPETAKVLVPEAKPLIDFGDDATSSQSVKIEMNEKNPAKSFPKENSEDLFLQDENEIEEMENWLKVQELENSMANLNTKNK